MRYFKTLIPSLILEKKSTYEYYDNETTYTLLKPYCNSTTSFRMDLNYPRKLLLNLCYYFILIQNLYSINISLFLVLIILLNLFLLTILQLNTFNNTTVDLLL